MSANSLTAQGLTIKSLPDIVSELNDGMRSIYGQDINLDPNTPDGQLVALIAQAAIDIEEYIAAVYASFDPDEAIGVSLDRRVAINGIKRAGGTYTQQPIDVTVDRALSLLGLDTAPNNAFKVQDAQGNEYQLVSTTNFSGAGTQSLIFQAVEVGAVTSALNQITVVVTITLGVTGVINSSAPASVGVAQESDPELRTRRSRSVSIPSKGYLDGLIGSLLDLPGVSQVEVFENVTNIEDVRGIPGHSIWAIIAGGTSADIADVIYIKRSLGCGMRGATEVEITQVDGLICTIKFDRPIVQDLYAKFNIEAITGVIDLTYLRAQIFARLAYRINQMADASTIVALVKDIYPDSSVSEEGVSIDGVDYFSLVATDTVQHQFALAFLDINGTIS